MSSTQRFIGIRHRVKRTAEGEARPTMVAIKEGDQVKTFKLEDEQAELDFLLNRFPVAYRNYNPETDDLADFYPHQVKWTKKKGPDGEIVKENGKTVMVPHKVPSAYDGFKVGDTIAMILGGSGDRFAAALSRRAEEISPARVMRIPSFVFKGLRTGDDKDQDQVQLAELVQARSELFQLVGPRDRELICVKETLFARRDAQKARIGCEQRLRQRFIGQVFLEPGGRYPEGNIEDDYDRLKANDVVLLALLKEEQNREKELRSAVRALEVWDEIFEPLTGCGEVLAAGLIAPIGDIRRFGTKHQLKAFCGVHVQSDGRFPRKRSGSVANWNPRARQALYLLADQFNRRPDSDWGLKLRDYKVKLREKHPEVEEVNGKKRYTDGHIHKMAIWRTLTKFVEWLWREWTRLENRHQAKISQLAEDQAEADQPAETDQADGDEVKDAA